MVVNFEITSLGKVSTLPLAVFRPILGLPFGIPTPVGLLHSASVDSVTVNPDDGYCMSLVPTCSHCSHSCLFVSVLFCLQC